MITNSSFTTSPECHENEWSAEGRIHALIIPSRAVVHEMQAAPAVFV